MQVTANVRQVLTDALLEGEPLVLNGVEVGRVCRQALLGTAPPGNELAGVRRPREAGVVIAPYLSRCESGHQTVLAISLEERGIAVALEDKRGDEQVLVEHLKNAHVLGAMPQLLAPARLALGAPPLGTDFIVIHPGFIDISELFCRDPGQLRAQLRPQLFVPLGIAKGLFLCV
jgi:hypothetical protein